MCCECSSAYARLNLLLGCQPSTSGYKAPQDLDQIDCMHMVHVQAEEGRQAAVSSFQACIASALQAGEVATAVTAAEQVVACLGNADGQKAADALLMAQSCRGVLDMEGVYRAAADPQARTCLIIVFIIKQTLAKLHGLSCCLIIQLACSQSCLHNQTADKIAFV